ncbi:MAG: citrate/2-methylcitrate synthase [Coriobacteriaceae bacterium]
MTRAPSSAKRFAEQLAAGTEYEAELNLLKSIERLTPEVFAREKGSTKELCANVDMYSGFIYSMMGIPEDLFTPLFACARMAGWAAHRFEEIAAGKRIIRPAYKTPSAAPSPTSRSSVGRDRSRRGWYTR